MKQVLPEEMVWESGIRMYTDFFPVDLLGEMANTAQTQPDRKVLFDTLSGDPFPEPFHTAAQLVVDHTPAEAINTLIVKRYELDEPSTAFDFHHDPEEYEGWLILSSLGGLATLTVIDLNVGQIDFKCPANTVLVLPAYGTPKLHKISSPDPAHGIRPFAFFGHRSHETEPVAT